MGVGFVTGTQNQGNIGDVPEDAGDDITLDRLTAEEKDKILRAYKQGRDAANNYYRSEVEPKIIRRMELYKADKKLYRAKFPALSELNNWVSKDIKTTIDWILPNLIEVFNSSDEKSKKSGSIFIP